MRSRVPDHHEAYDVPTDELPTVSTGTTPEDDLLRGELRGMLLAMSAVHDRPMPADLSGHVATCVQCAAGEEVDANSDHPPSGRRGRGRFVNGLAAIAAFMGVCLVCTVPALQTLAFALGVGMVGYVLHWSASSVPHWSPGPPSTCERPQRWRRVQASGPKASLPVPAPVR